MHITVVSEEGEPVVVEVDSNERLSNLIERVFPRLAPIGDTDIGIFNTVTLDELDLGATVGEAGLGDGDEIILEFPAGCAGITPADLMAWLSGLLDQAREIPVETLFKYLDWVVTSAGAVELIRRGAMAIRRMRSRSSAHLEEVIRKIRSRNEWKVADLASQAGIKPNEAKGVLRLLGFEYNRHTRQYERVND